MNMKSMETDRLILRTAEPGDAAAVASYARRNREFLEPWEPLRDESFYSLTAQRKMLEADRAEMEAGRMCKLWIFLKEAPDTVIGSVALSNIIRGVFQNSTLGYRLDSGLLGRGYMPEAVKAIVDYGFGVLKLHRIEANIIPRNEASLSVVRKLGFQEEGLARKYLKINGKWEDHYHMVLLNEALEAEEEQAAGRSGR